MDVTRRKYTATVKVVGFGRDGADAIGYLIQSELEGIDFVVVGNDTLSVEGNGAPAATESNGKVNGHRDSHNLRTLDSGTLGYDSNLIAELEDVDMVVLLAGGGDEPEVEAAPVIGSAARDMGILLAGIMSPVAEEASGEEGVKLFRETVDMLIIVPDSTLLPGFFAALRGS